HWVHFAPDDVVLNPESEILDRDAEPEDVVIGADDPDGTVRFQHATAFGEPGAAESIVFCEVVELVPGVVDAVHLRVVRAEKIARELQIIRRIGENEIDARAGNLLQFVDAITNENPSALRAAL